MPVFSPNPSLNVDSARFTACEPRIEGEDIGRAYRCCSSALQPRPLESSSCSGERWAVHAADEENMDDMDAGCWNMLAFVLLWMPPPPLPLLLLGLPLS